MSILNERKIAESVATSYSIAYICTKKIKQNPIPLTGGEPSFPVEYNRESSFDERVSIKTNAGANNLDPLARFSTYAHTHAAHEHQDERDARLQLGNSSSLRFSLSVLNLC